MDKATYDFDSTQSGTSIRRYHPDTNANTGVDYIAIFINEAGSYGIGTVAGTGWEACVHVNFTHRADLTFDRRDAAEEWGRCWIREQDARCGEVAK